MGKQELTLTVIAECTYKEQKSCKFKGIINIECFKESCPYLLIHSIEPKAETETPQCNCGADTKQAVQRRKLRGLN